MTPLPKRRHSSQRQCKRERANLFQKMPDVSLCPKCKNARLPHRACPKCGFYK